MPVKQVRYVCRKCGYAHSTHNQAVLCEKQPSARFRFKPGKSLYITLNGNNKPVEVKIHKCITMYDPIKGHDAGYKLKVIESGELLEKNFTEGEIWSYLSKVSQQKT